MEAPAPGGPITAESIVGTKWRFGGFTIAFEPDGKLKLNDALPGEWSIEGDTLKVSAMGQSHEAKIEGDKITYDGNPLEKVQ